MAPSTRSTARAAAPVRCVTDRSSPTDPPRLIGCLPAETLARVIDFAINGEGGKSFARRPHWLRLALVSRRWYDPALAAYLEVADISTLRVAELPLAHAARIRTLELVCGIIADDEMIEALEGAFVVPRRMTEVAQALSALRPALGGLRSLRLEPAVDVFSTLSGTPMGPGGGSLVFPRDMEALRSLDTSMIDQDAVVDGRDELPVARPLPAMLRILKLGVLIMGSEIGEEAADFCRARTATEDAASFQASALSLVRLDLCLTPPHDGTAFDSGLVRAFLLQHSRVEHLTLHTARPTMLRSDHVAAPTTFVRSIFTTSSCRRPPSRRWDASRSDY